MSYLQAIFIYGRAVYCFGLLIDMNDAIFEFWRKKREAMAHFLRRASCYYDMKRDNFLQPPNRPTTSKMTTMAVTPLLGGQ
eukprot:scaffold23738_cov115-Skeletonema_dohrnii-CCMP3373.AAC.2